MKKRYQFVRKSYAMHRMAAAIKRAIAAVTILEKDQAARWAAAWGLLCGIKTKPVSVKRSNVIRLHAVSDDALGAASMSFPAKVSVVSEGKSGGAVLHPAPQTLQSSDSSSQA